MVGWRNIFLLILSLMAGHGLYAQLLLGPEGHGVDYPFPWGKSYVTDMVPEQQGHWWVATFDRGLVEFDGTRYFAIQPDEEDPRFSEERIEAICRWGEQLVLGYFRGGVRFFDPESHQFSTPENLNNRLSDERISFLQPVSNDVLLLGTHTTGLTVYDRSVDSLILLSPQAFFPEYDEVMFNIIKGVLPIPGREEMYWVSTLRGLLELNLKTLSFERCIPLTQSFCDNPAEYVGSEGGVRSFAYDGSHLWCASWGGGLLRVNPSDGRFKTFKFQPTNNASGWNNNIIDLLLRGDTVYLNSSGYGFGYFHKPNETFHFPRYLNGQPWKPGELKFYEVSADQVWMGFDTGLRKYDRSTNFMKRSWEQSNLYEVLRMDSMWYGCNIVEGRSRLFHSKDTTALFETRQGNLIAGIEARDDGLLYVLDFSRLGLFDPAVGVVEWQEGPGSELAREGEFLGFHAASDSMLLADKKLQELYKIDPRTGSFEVIGENDLVFSWITAFLPTDDGGTWMGTEEGLVLLDAKGAVEQIFRPEHFEELDFRLRFVRALASSKPGELWAACAENGLVRLVKDAEDWKVSGQWTAAQLGIKKMTALACLGGITWLGGKEGLAAITHRGDSLRLFPSSMGVAPVSEFVVSDDRLYAVKPDGVHAIATDRLMSFTSSTEPYLRSVSSFGQELDLSSWAQDHQLHDLSSREHFIELALGFRSEMPVAEIDARYQLLPDTHWYALADDQRISLNFLGPDAYCVRVRVRQPDLAWSNPIELLRWTIPVPWWQRLWFRVLLALLLVVFTAGAFTWRQNRWRKRIVKEQAHKEQLMELEMEALRSQINPHFIFNALNAIRFHFISGERKIGQSYTEKFSSMLRFVLVKASEKWIPLADDLAALKLYFELEQSRFDPPFAFSIHVSPDVDQSQERIPPMLLQPFVENAIWHGISPKKETGSIEVRIRVEGDYLLIIVEDDGIGREAAAELRAQRPAGSRKRSQGMDVTQRRIELLENESGVWIEDLKDESGKALGTRIHLKLYRYAGRGDRG